MRKRAILILIAIAVIAAAIIGYVLLRHATPPATVKLLPPADAYLYFDLATVRRAAVLGDLPQVEFDTDYADFIQQTGFNLEKDLDEAAFALQRSAANPQQAEWRNTGVFTATFDRAKIDAYFKKTAASTETYRNTTIYVIPLPGRAVRVAILGPKTVAATNTEGPYVMQGIIDRHAQFSSGEPDLIHAYYSNIPWGSLAWAIARPPATTAGGNARLELPGGLGVYLPPETVVIASLRYLGSVDFRAQAIATSNDAAQRVADQLSAFLALFRALQSQAHGGDKDVKTFFESIKVSLQDNRAEMQATVPAGFVKKLVSEAPAAGMEVTPKRESQPYDVKRCTPKVVKQVSMPKNIGKFVAKGEKSTGYQPVISYEVLESGDVKNAQVKRSSGFAKVDAYALHWVEGRRYNSRPGCGVIETEEGVTIDRR